MKFWVKLSRIIFRLAASNFLRKLEPKSIESVLKNSLDLITHDIQDEIRHFILLKQNQDGGFADRAGKSDLYYSLFGYFLAEAYGIQQINEPLKRFVKGEIEIKNLTGVHLYCAAILYSRLFKYDNTSVELSKKVKLELKSAAAHNSNSPSQRIQYSSFMGFLALYYLEDFPALKNLFDKYKFNKSANQHIDTSANQAISTTAHQHINPCPVTAANAILLDLSGKSDPSSGEKIVSFFRSSGGFKAVQDAPCEDLLSTGVALYALKFINADIRTIKPECLSFIDGLYENGGFRAVQTDFETDVEYTFYGLLALGALK